MKTKVFFDIKIRPGARRTDERDGAVITWQAKFLETRISTKTDELKAAIETTKRKNPSVTKILFYLNQNSRKVVRRTRKNRSTKRI